MPARTASRLKFTHVPFKGSGPGVTALLGGQVTMMFAGPLAFEQHIRSGKLRALAVADRKRSSVLRDVPTMAEAGFGGVETGTWFGFLGPAGTPPAIAQTLAPKYEVNVPKAWGKYVAYSNNNLLLEAPDGTMRIVDVEGKMPEYPKVKALIRWQ